MIRHRRLEHMFVDSIPEQLEPGLLYVSICYATVMHLCCCGCGREIVTPLSPAQWQLIYDGESVSLRPSVGNWNIPCRSHYIIRNGQVIEAPRWSEEAVTYGEARDKKARNGYYAAKDAVEIEVEAHTPPASITRRTWARKISNFLGKHRLR